MTWYPEKPGALNTGMHLSAWTQPSQRRCRVYTPLVNKHVARVAAGRRERREQSEQRSDHAALHNHSFYSESESERIVDHDFKFGTQWYKVAWKGWSEVYDSTWEPRSDMMKKAAKAVLKYEKENDISKEKPDRRKLKR